MTFSDQAMQKAFLRLQACAIAGERCPTNDQFENSSIIGALAKAGYIRVEVSMHNFRQIFILTGANAGKATAAPPLTKLGKRPSPYLVQTAQGTFRYSKQIERQSRFRVPSLRDYSRGF